MEVETIKKSQRETTLKIRTLESHRCKHNKQNSRDRRESISGAEDTIENIDTTIKEKKKKKKLLTQNTQEIQDTMQRPNLGIIGIKVREDLHLKGPVNIFNKIREKTSRT